MKTDQPAKELETLGEAARRLLAELDERLKRPAAERAAEIHFPGDFPVPGERGEEAAPGKAAAPSPVIVCHGVRLGVSGQTNVVRIYAASNSNDCDDWLW